MQAKNDHFYESFSKLSLAQRRLTGDERSRILAQMYAKAGVEAPESAVCTIPAGAVPDGREAAQTPAPRTVPTGTQPPQTRRRAAATRRAARTARAVPFAAVLAVALAVGAGAAGIALLKMGSGKIGFFENAPASAAESTDPVDAPRGSYDAAVEAMEAYTADVGVSATSDGVTITLDSVSMDGASMNVFLTVTGDNLIQRMREYALGTGQEEYYPDWDLLESNLPHFYSENGDGILLNGEASLQNGMFSGGIIHDAYRVDDNTATYWLHYVLSELPQGDTVTLSMTETGFFGNGGRWELTANFDGASLRAGTREAAPGTYETAQTLFYDGVTYDVPLHLVRMAFGPVGGMLRVDVGSAPVATGSGESLPDDAYFGLDGDLLYLVDDTGTEIRTIFAGNAVGGTNWANYSLTALGEGAASVTMTPVLFLPDDQVTNDRIDLTSDQLRQGVALTANNIGGSYTVQNFTIKGSAICYELVPHGWVGGVPPELTPDDDHVTTANGHTALRSETLDPTTGVYTVRLDYYAATEDELNQITNWHYTKCNAYALDTDHTVTLPLE